MGSGSKSLSDPGHSLILIYGQHYLGHHLHRLGGDQMSVQVTGVWKMNCMAAQSHPWSKGSTDTSLPATNERP